MTKVSTGPIPNGPSTPGWIAYFNKLGNTHLIVDVFGFFTDENFTAAGAGVQAAGTATASLAVG
jgi:hypothetical protein